MIGNEAIQRRLAALGLDDERLIAEYRKTADDLQKLLIKAVEKSQSIDSQLKEMMEVADKIMEQGINLHVIQKVDMRINSLKSMKREIDKIVVEITRQLNENEEEIRNRG